MRRRCVCDDDDFDRVDACILFIVSRRTSVSYENTYFAV